MRISTETIAATMKMQCRWHLALLVLCAMGWTAAARAEDGFKFFGGDVGLNVYGLSYLFDRDRARELGLDNNLNPGLGVRWRFAEWRQWSFFADAAVFEDSGGDAAKTLGVAALWHFGGGFRAGAALAYFNSHTYNDGDAFVAPLPLATYEAGPVTLNLTFFPKIERYNEIATLGFWITYWPGRR
jgi:hypothetical protein